MIIIGINSAAEYLGVSYDTVKRWIAKGKFPASDLKVYGSRETSKHAWSSDCLDRVKPFMREWQAVFASNKKCKKNIAEMQEKQDNAGA